jgi:hypothetical protein
LTNVMIFYFIDVDEKWNEMFEVVKEKKADTSL